jgi:hypothetical protein
MGRALPPERIEIEGLVIRRWTAHDIDARFHAIAASQAHLSLDPWTRFSVVLLSGSPDC